MYVCPQNHPQKQKPHTLKLTLEKVMLLACSLLRQIIALWSGLGDSKNRVSKESIRNTKDQLRRQLEVLEEMQARKHEETTREPKQQRQMLTNNAHKDSGMPGLSIHC